MRHNRPLFVIVCFQALPKLHFYNFHLPMLTAMLTAILIAMFTTMLTAPSSRHTM